LLEISSISSMSVHSADVVKHVNENWRTWTCIMGQNILC
jgi:hypothetical protein